ncbi:MAG: DUF3147 family protein, partial [Phycisphaeraceae bacterium]|nr:DUF3147 family protein [Phycisphaeraceae bacterium]
MHPGLKILITAVLIVIISEVSKRTGYLGGLIASLPLVSYLSIIWLYVERDSEAEAIEVISQHSISVFWFVLPTLPFFVILPLLLKQMPFIAAMAVSTTIMFACYAGTM